VSGLETNKNCKHQPKQANFRPLSKPHTCAPIKFPHFKNRRETESQLVVLSKRKTDPGKRTALASAVPPFGGGKKKQTLRWDLRTWPKFWRPPALL